VARGSVSALRLAAARADLENNQITSHSFKSKKPSNATDILVVELRP
jgi:hypothetical protein